MQRNFVTTVQYKHYRLLVAVSHCVCSGIRQCLEVFRVASQPVLNDIFALIIKEAEQQTFKPHFACNYLHFGKSLVGKPVVLNLENFCKKVITLCHCNNNIHKLYSVFTTVADCASPLLCHNNLNFNCFLIRPLLVCTPTVEGECIMKEKLLTLVCIIAS